MNIGRVLLGCLLAVLLGGGVRAEDEAPWFEQVFDTSAYNMSITQDREGFLWLTTTEGLIRYDGYEKMVFSAGPKGLTSNFVPCAFEDSREKMWIVTLSGLDLYDKVSGKIRHFEPREGDAGAIASNTFNWAPRLVAEDRQGVVWIGSRDGLYAYHPESESFEAYRHQAGNDHSLADNDVWTVVADRRGRLWIGTSTGLDRLDPVTGEFVHFRHDAAASDSLGAGTVYAVYEDGDGAIWVGGEKGGLQRYIEKTGGFFAYTHNPEDPGSIANNEVFSITGDRSGNLWLGRTFSTSVGLERFDKASGRFTRYRHDPKRSGSLSGDIVLSCFQDRSGILWIPENTGMVNKVDPYSHRFALHLVDAKRPETSGLGGLTSVYQDSRGTVWSGGQRGLSRFDQATGNWTAIAIDPGDPRALWNQYVFSVLEDGDGEFWVATDDGYLNLFDRDRGTVIRRYRNPYVEHTARQIIEDRTAPGRLWFGVEGHGLFSFDKHSGRFEKQRSDPNDPRALGNDYVYSLLQEESGLIWVQSQGGLHRLDPKTGQFTRYTADPNNLESLSSNVVNDLLVDSRGLFWVSTDLGLNLLDRTSGTFQRFGGESGFTTPILRAMVEDLDGNLWLGSNDGLFVFDPRQRRVLRHYTSSDGLQGDSFSLYGGSALRDRDGVLWFAGLSGLNSFRPEALRHNDRPPPVYLAKLLQGGEELVARARVTATEEIHLDWRHNFFEFEYVALNYSQPHRNQYRYRLEGWDSDWYHAGTRRFGRYSGLSGGRYTLEILAANNDGVWSASPWRLRVVVESPFWTTWWFYSLLAGIGGGGSLLFYWYRIRQLTNFNRALRRAYVDVQTAESKYRSIFENALDGIFQISPKGGVISANPAAAAILGYASPEDLCRQVGQVRELVHLGDRRWRRLVVELMRAGAITNYELPVRRGESGEVIWLAVNLRVIRDQEGRVLYIDGLLEDITSRINTARQLTLYREHLEQLVDERTREYQKINADLQQEIHQRERVEEELLQARKLESIGVLAGGIAHDFNNLMTVVMGNVNIAQLRGGPEVERELERAVQALNRAKDLTQKFITFSSGGAPIKTLEDIEEVTRSAVELALSGSNVQASFEVEQALPPVSIDRSHVSQAMCNIVENSKQAMPGGGNLLIRLSAMTLSPAEAENSLLPLAPGPYVRIDFYDSGRGIAAAHLSKVFDPYFTTAEMGTEKGKGLGLTIAYSIIRKHGGQITIDSEEGRGTLVRLVLPAINDPAFPEKAAVVVGAGESVGRVLLMDDEEMLRQLAEAMLGAMGYEATLTPDGDSTIEAYTQALREGRRYDAVILDLTIPGGAGGREIVKILRQLDPQVCAIVSSGYAADPVVADYRRYGFVAALSKPYSMQALQELLEEVVPRAGG